jgi:hypothetical protein
MNVCMYYITIQFVLGTAVSFASQFEDGIVVHISIGKQRNLPHTFGQSKALTQFKPCRWKLTQCTIAKSSKSDAYNSVPDAL